MSEEYRIVPAPIPSKHAKKGSVYKSVLEDFLRSGESSVRVEIPNSKATTVVVGLRQAIASAGVEATVVQRGPEVYLKK